MLPVLAVLLVAVLEWGQVLVREVALVQLVRDAALAGSRTEAADDPAQAAHARAQTALAEAGYGSADISVDAVGLACGGAIRVTVRVPFEATVPLVPVPSTLGANAVARLEDQ